MKGEITGREVGDWVLRRNRGESYSQIARETGRHRQTVRRWVNLYWDAQAEMARQLNRVYQSNGHSILEQWFHENGYRVIDCTPINGLEE